mgnify:CR=1 FL=1
MGNVGSSYKPVPSSPQHTDRTQTREQQAAAHQQEGQEIMGQSLAPPALQVAATPNLPTGGVDDSGENGFFTQTKENAAPFQLQAKTAVAPSSQRPTHFI